MSDKKMLWIATDIRHDCSRCAMNEKTCKRCCEQIADRLDVFSVYAVRLREPNTEYQGM